MKQIPEMLKDIKILLQTGIQDGITYAKESLDKTKNQFQRLQFMGQNVTRSAFFRMFAKHDGTKEEAANVITNEVLPAFKDLEDYLFNDYYKHVRSQPSIKSLSNLKGTVWKFNNFSTTKILREIKKLKPSKNVIFGNCRGSEF